MNTDPVPDTEMGIIAQNVQNIHTLAFAQMVQAKSDEEVLSALETARKNAKKAGLDKLLEFKTQRWQENVQKINAKK
ncbi:hypothetical protein [Paenibacillus rhizoplanae]|uniref:hypothetical protein n=1 Tax=Paenibacillus rhizoplanae TaxID=1917181 RepID=UPI003615B84A